MSTGNEVALRANEVAASRQMKTRAAPAHEVALRANEVAASRQMKTPFIPSLPPQAALHCRPQAGTSFARFARNFIPFVLFSASGCAII
jgi:hypothetical protein